MICMLEVPCALPLSRKSRRIRQRPLRWRPSERLSRCKESWPYSRSPQGERMWDGTKLARQQCAINAAIWSYCGAQMWPLVSYGCGSQLLEQTVQHLTTDASLAALIGHGSQAAATDHTASHKAFIVGGAVALIGTLKPLYKLASRSGLSRVTTRMACTAE